MASDGGTARSTTPGTCAFTVAGVPVEDRKLQSAQSAGWTRAQFAAWAERVAADHGYTVEFAPVGPEVDGVGSPTQMAVFRR